MSWIVGALRRVGEGERRSSRSTTVYLLRSLTNLAVTGSPKCFTSGPCPVPHPTCPTRPTLLFPQISQTSSSISFFSQQAFSWIKALRIHLLETKQGILHDMGEELYSSEAWTMSFSSTESPGFTMARIFLEDSGIGKALNSN